MSIIISSKLYDKCHLFSIKLNSMCEIGTSWGAHITLHIAKSIYVPTKPHKTPPPTHINMHINEIQAVTNEMHLCLHKIQSLAQRIHSLPQGKDCRSTLSRYIFYYDCDHHGYQCHVVRKKAEAILQHTCATGTATLGASEAPPTTTIEQLLVDINWFVEQHNITVHEINTWAYDLDARRCFGCQNMQLLNM